jgi:fermentation-respiration switch protein FrsA (DUF1100 family)
MVTFKFSALLPLFLIPFFAFVALRYLEKHTLFYPTKEIDFSPKENGLDFEDVFFKSSGKQKLNGWFIPAAAAKYTIFFCHGNAGNISHRMEKISFFNRLGCNVFIFDYRGYGLSKGNPSERNLYLDAKSAYDYLLSRGIKENQIIGYGESLGSAVIIDVAYRNKMRALIVEGGFSSGKDMAAHAFPFLPYWVFSIRLDSAGKIKSIDIPKLIIHSINDEIVPYRLARKLFEAAAEPKEFLQVSGGHNTCFYDSEAFLKEKVADFLNRI